MAVTVTTVVCWCLFRLLLPATLLAGVYQVISLGRRGSVVRGGGGKGAVDS